MLGLCKEETYGAMSNYNGVDDDGNEDRNDDNNAAYRSGSDGLIFDMTPTPQSHGGGPVKDGYVTTAIAHYIYVCIALYIYPIKTI